MRSSRVRVAESRSHSLRWRLTGLISGLCLMVLVVVLYAAYREVETTLEQGAAERARQAASQVATLFGRSALQSLDQLQRIGPGLRDYLRDPTDARLAAARAALAQLAPGSNRRITVWNAAGALLFELPDSATSKSSADHALPPPGQPPDAGIGPMRAVGDRAVSDVAIVIEDETPAGKKVLGTLATRGALAITPPDALNRLVGMDARILFGNRRGDVWTDATHLATGPAIDMNGDGTRRYRLGEGGERIGAISQLAGTPWVVWVEFSRAEATARANMFLQRMATFGLLVAVATVMLARWFAIRITTPVAEITTAAEAVAGGDYSPRVAAAGVDEIGRLGRAFNTMTDEVANAHRGLEERVRERTRDLNTALAALGNRSRERETYLATIVDGSADAIYGQDLDGNVSSWNKGAEAIFGYKPEEMIGKPVLRLFPDDRISEEAEFQKAIDEGGSVDHYQTVRRTKDGQLFDASVTASPIRDARGELIGVSKVIRDITEAKRAEDQLRASEGRYHTLFDYAPDGILIADSRSYYLDANPSMCRMLGYEREEIIGLHASDIVVPTEIANIEPALEAIASSREYHREWEFRRKDASVFLAEVIATQMPDGQLLGMVRDVTDRNQAVEALRTAEERMRFALESAGVGIWDMDYRTGLLRFSDTLERQYGLEPGTFSGTVDEFLGRVHPDDRSSVNASLANAMKSGSDFSLQHRVVRPDGTVRWINGAGRVLLGEDGTPLRGVGISLDVTERHTLEAQYQQAQKMEAVGRLAGGVAHDFNNLLTVILGHCELMMEDQSLDADTLSSTKWIQTSANQAAALTRQLLAFSRKQIIEPTMVDLNAVITELRPMLTRLIGEDIEVVVEQASDLGIVKADRSQIEQVAMNLAVNARDAMPHGGTLTVQTANVELDGPYAAVHLGAKAGAYVVLTVSDTGSGMSPEVQSRLFEPFFTTKAVGKGTGLGLATVHGIVARSGGSVGVYSEVGKGTSFKVYFPRVDEAASAIARPAAKERPLFGTETILVVEDSDLLRGVAKQLLERQGYTVLLAGGANEARQVFDRHAKIDIVLTDVVMPGASGPQLTGQLLAQRPDLKVIYMSGYTEEAIVHHGVLRPGVAFLHKPFTSDTLCRKIRETLDG